MLIFEHRKELTTILNIKIMTFSTTVLNGKIEQVIVMKTSKREACKFGNLENKKGLTPVVVCFGSDEVYKGYGYTVEEAIKNSKLV